MPRDLLLIALSMFLWGIGESAFLNFQPLYLQQLGASPLSIGAILGAAGVTTAIAHIPAGYLADRIGRRPVLWASWIIGMLAAWIMALSPTLPVFVAGMLLYRTTSFVMAPLNSYLTAARGRWSVGRVLTLNSAVYNTGAILGPLLGGLVGYRIGLRQVYFGAALLFMLSTIVILFIRSQPVEHSAQEIGRNNLLFSRRYITFLGVLFVVILATTLPQPLSPNYLQNVHGLNLQRIGQLYSVASLGMVVMNLILGHLDARFGFILSQILVAAFALLLWKGTGMIWFLPGYFLLGGYRTLYAFAAAQGRALVNAAKMGLAFGINESINASAVILASPLAGYLYQINPALMYPVGLGLMAFAILISLAFLPAGKAATPRQELETDQTVQDCA
jgi:MFS family permease